MADKTPKSSKYKPIPKAPLKPRGRKLSGYLQVPDDRTDTMVAKQTTPTVRTLEQNFGKLLQEIFGWTDADPEHEVEESLVNMSITRWEQFIRMTDDEIRTLTKKSRGEHRVGIGLFSRNQLLILRAMARERLMMKTEGARDVSTYALEDYLDFEFQFQEKKLAAAKAGASQTAAIVPQSQSNSSTGRYIKSDAEKKLEAWDRLKPDKSDFDILRTDGEYEDWKESFASVAEVQTFSRVIDPNFEPHKIKDPHDKELWKKQQAYMWTVLKRVFQNPLGSTCYRDFKDTRDARGAYFAHDDLQKESPSRMFDAGNLITELKSLHISSRTGTRVKFIADWFAKLDEFHAATSNTTQNGYELARSIILSAVNTDNDMTNAFTDLKPVKNDAVDLANMKKHLLIKAGLFDGMDSTSQSPPTSASAVSAFAHQLGISHDDVYEFIANKSRRESNDPGLRLPDEIYQTLSREDRTQWYGFSDDARRAIVMKLRSPTLNPQRKAYNHESTPSHTGDTSSASIIDSIADLHVKTHDILSAYQSQMSDATSSLSSHTRPPSTSANDSNSDSASKRSTEQTSNTGTSKLPLKSSLARGDPRRVMADNKTPTFDTDGTFLGFKACRHMITPALIDDRHDQDTRTYTVTNRYLSRETTHALIDRGANGIVAGEDCVWLGGPVVERYVHITGMDNHQVRNVRIGTVGALVESANRGTVICIFNEAAYTGRNQSILSSIQMEHHKNRVDDRSRLSDGGQQIITADGTVLPLSFIGGLCYLKMRPFTRREYDKYPHIVMSSDQEWDPRVFDNEIDPKDPSIKAANPRNLHLLPHKDYNIKGEYIGAHTTDCEVVPTIQGPQPSINFWIPEREYERNETIARCVYAAQRANYGDPYRQHHTVYDGRVVCHNDIISNTNPRTHVPHEQDYERLKPLFAWIPTKLIKKTFENSTQYGYMPSSPEGNLFKRWHAPNPALNVFRLQDDLLTDKIHSNTPAIEGGFTDAQIYFGRKSHIIHVESISKTKKFLQGLQNFVRKWGAPLRLLADHINYHASFQVLDYLRLLWIGLWFSEAYYQHQNPFERRFQTLKRITNRTMDRTNTPPELWFLCLCYVAYVLNRVSDPTLNDRQPIFVATGQIADISAITVFQWLEPVYYKKDDRQYTYPDTGETLGYFVGIAEHVGHAMTFRIWNKQTGRVVERSSVRTALDSDTVNARALPLVHGETNADITHKSDTSMAIGEEHVNTPRASNFVFTPQRDERSPRHVALPTDSTYGENTYLQEPNESATDDSPDSQDFEQPIIAEDGTRMVVLLDDDGHPKLDSEGNAIMIPGKTPKELRGVTFKHRQDDGSILRARVLGPTATDLGSNEKGRQLLNEFRIKYDTTQVEDTMAYNDIMNHLHRDQTEDGGEIWKFRRILGHRGPLSHRDHGFLGSRYNVRVERENGEITDEPLSRMIKDSPIPLAEYAQANGLLETDGWKYLKSVVRRAKRFQRMAKQARLRSYRTSPKYMYGFQVPRDYKEALELDKRNGNTRWADATRLELEQLKDYNTFIDKGIYAEHLIPKGFKRIRVHLVYATKHDGRHKARLVADGHLTDVPLDSVYAGVVSIRGLRMVLFLAELNGIEAYATDIGNAYLEAKTNEKVCIKAGPEFGELEGHLLIIYKALYGLRSSGKQFGDLLASCLRDLGFFPSKAEPQIFMRESDGIYEYVATYVDDLCLAVRDPETLLKQLQSAPFNFKLKGSGPMAFHLGCGFERDENGTLCMNPRKYIDKMMQSYEQLFGVKPGTKPYSPLEEGDHPELDTTSELENEDVQKYQSLIGSLQWLITLGRFDIQTAVMTLSSFRASPRKGHMERARRIYSYINRFKHFVIRYRTEEPDLSDLDGAIQVDWDKDVYEEFQEELPADAPRPLGKRVTLIHWFDANLMHDVLSGKSVTGCIHFANKTPMMWYSKKQATSETATYGAEFVAGRTCIEQIVDLRNSFRYLGVPIHNVSYMFGDNESMINSSKYQHARLHKRHNILSYHYVRSMIARGYIALTHTKSASNLADVVSKHWGYRSAYPLIRPVLHHAGDTASLYVDDEYTYPLPDVPIPSSE